ncbi:hypothetical protein O181_020851 [Austropuccinia psidii MF-1]|uniref:Uncharacterized protein n=1 Tax=Austropuccinia psidii MF-1 TaxID=1389203 RepID=A0A9Q3GV74_9BASI|nr:hypothetical protein [Austropuccinia psidii MF-1]
MAFAKEQAELNKKLIAKPSVKPKSEEEVKPTENKSEDKSTSISHVEDWSNWKPTTLSSANDPFESHIGLRQTKQMMEIQAQNQELKIKNIYSRHLYRRRKRRKKSHNSYQIPKFKYSKTRTT